MNYQPAPVPTDPKDVPAYLARELRRISDALRDDAPAVLYLTQPVDQGSLTAGVSANWRIAAGNVLRISTSSTVTLTGLALGPAAANRVLTVVNVGTGVAVLKNDDAASSATARFALSAPDWQISANGAATLWVDARSNRLRGISRA